MSSIVDVPGTLGWSFVPGTTTEPGRPKVNLGYTITDANYVFFYVNPISHPVLIPTLCPPLTLILFLIIINLMLRLPSVIVRNSCNIRNGYPVLCSRNTLF